MCGIYGALSKSRQFNKNEIDGINESFIKEMSHRGPDQNGFFVSEDEKLMIGHLRLSIIDLDSGNQPMVDDENKNCVAFNGEIYNFKELKQNSPYPFVTNSDTEVILAKYSELGGASFDLFNGMYGIALFDKNCNDLVLAVDPLGIKSIYVYEDSNYLLFSSELVSLCLTLKECFGIKLEQAHQATDKFLYHGMYIDNETPVKNIQKLMPGTILTIDLKSNTKKQRDIKYRSSVTQELTLDNVLEESIKRQLVSDVPICLFLSGGIDSSIIATHLSKYCNDVTAYIFSFSNNEEINESLYAIELASKLAMKYKIVELTNDDLQKSFLEAIDSMDEPISDFATIPLLELAREAKNNYKVCLLGDGGDELFFGYTHHKFWKMKRFFANYIFRFLGLNSLISRLSYSLEYSKTNLVKKLALLLKIANPKSISYGPFSNCQHLLKRVNSDQKVLISIDSMLEWEKKNLLNRKLLQKTDRITMRHSLEARVPLLDLELLDFVKRFEIEDCIVSGKGKMPLREHLNRFLSGDLVSRKKQGFRTPADKWLRQKLGDTIHSRLQTCAYISSFISRTSIDQLFLEHKASMIDHSTRILSLYALSSFWMKIDYKEIQTEVVN